jgi:hypothetical protein
MYSREWMAKMRRRARTKAKKMAEKKIDGPLRSKTKSGINGKSAAS